MKILLLLRAALMAVIVVSVVGPHSAAAQDGRALRHYQKNMSFGMTTERQLADDILARAPDTVTLQEVNRDNDMILGMLAGAYPSQKFCYFDGIGGVAVLSRWPLIGDSAQCIRPLGATAIQVMMPEGPVWVISVHLETRDLPRHDRQANKLAQKLAGMVGPKIIGGDFNDLPSSGPVQTIARGAGVWRIGDAISTYRLGGVIGVPIDFVFASHGTGQVSQLPYLGSDHYGVLAEFTMRF